MTAIWKIVSELPRAFTPTGWGKTRFLGPTLTLTEHVSAMNMISTIGKKHDLSIYMDSHTTVQRPTPAMFFVTHDFDL